MKKENFLINLAELQEISGKDYQTIKKKLINLTPDSTKSGQLRYDARTAIPLLFKIEQSSSAELASFKVLREKSEAELAAAKAEKISLQVSQMKKELVYADEIKLTWSSLVTAFRSKMLSIPSKCALRVAGIKDPREVESLLKVLVHEALIELQEVNVDSK